MVQDLFLSDLEKILIFFEVLCSCKLANFQRKLIQNEQRLSSLSTKTIPRSIQWSSSRVLVLLLRDSIFPQVLEDFLEVLMVGDLHIVEFHL